MTIVERLAALLGRKSRKKDETLDVLRRELGKAPETHAVGDLIPMLVPRAFSEAGWPGPIHRLAFWEIASEDLGLPAD